MPFPFALSRIILVSFIIIANVISLLLAAVALYDKTARAFQVLIICFDTLTVLTVIGCLCHQYMRRDDDANNMRHLSMFGICGSLGVALAISLTVYARQDDGMDFCGDFAHTENPCAHAGAQLGVAYVSATLAALGFVISWMDKFPGAVKVTPRYPITEAPSSHFAAHGHDLDESYTRPPMRLSPRSRNNSEWTDVPL